MDHCIFATADIFATQLSVAPAPLAVIKVTCISMPANFYTFYSEAMFQRALVAYFAGDSSRGGGSSVAQCGQTYSITGPGITDHCDHVCWFYFNGWNSRQQLCCPHLKYKAIKSLISSCIFFIIMICQLSLRAQVLLPVQSNIMDINEIKRWFFHA